MAFNINSASYHSVVFGEFDHYQLTRKKTLQILRNIDMLYIIFSLYWSAKYLFCQQKADPFVFYLKLTNMKSLEKENKDL